MKIDTARLETQLRNTAIADWPRVIPLRHQTTPASAGHGSSRFSDPARGFRVLYAASTFATAFAEGVVRDRFVSKSRRFLYRPHLDRLALTEIGSSRALTLLDLTGEAAYRLGVDTDVKGARAHLDGQQFSAAVHARMPDVDGILFSSRLTAGPCIAIYDRAFDALFGKRPIPLIQSAQLPDELTRLGVTVRRARSLPGP